MSTSESQSPSSEEKEGPLYNQNDFIGNTFRLSPAYSFEIYQNRILVDIPVSRQNFPDPSVFLSEDIKDAVIKKSFLGSSYEVFLKMYQKKYYNGTPFSSDTIRIASELSKENADRLQGILQNVRDKRNIEAKGHPYAESFEYNNMQMQKRGEEMNAAIEKSALPVMRWITFVSLAFLLLLIGIIVMVVHSQQIKF